METLMHYVLIENEKIIGIINYEPSIPGSVTKISITDEQYKLITESETHYFDVLTNTVKAFDQSVLDQRDQKQAQDVINAENRFFLESTDWKVLRHLRQKALEVDTSLTESEYLALEQQRAEAAARIINN